MGLANSRARLQHLYGEAQKLELGTSEAGGLQVLIRIPYQEAGAGESGEESGMESAGE